jgi:DNA-binding CsgD family transcriptional regulator
MGVASDLFSMLESRASMAVFNADAELTSRTERFEREFPKRDIPNLMRAVSGLLRSEQHRQSIQIGDHRVVLQHLRGAQPCVVATAFPDIFGRLSPRQQEIAHLATDGATSVEIAQILNISVHTVRQHIKEVYRRLEVGNRAELAQVLMAS